MNIIDNDLLSMQEARILVENACCAQKKISIFSQEKLDEIIQGMLYEIEKYTEELAEDSYEETGCGKYEDKIIKNKFINTYLKKNLNNMKCVGLIENDKMNKTLNIGIPIGVIAAFISEISPVSTIIYKTILAIKSGNPIIFALNPRAKNVMKKTLDILIKKGEKLGVPEGSISYLSRISMNGSKELINHEGTSLILNTRVCELLPEINKSGKLLIYGEIGNAPVFIEKTADIKKAIRDIMISKSFDYGIMPGTEHSVVVDKCIAEEVKIEFQKDNAYFMKKEEAEQLIKILFDKNGEFQKEFIGKSPQFLARKANFKINENIKLLISVQEYVSLNNSYSKEKLCPVISFYVESDWEEACEKCIELLLNEKQGHTLIIHSKDENVINNFIMKKPVGRILINTPGVFGSIGGTTNLFPAMTLGSSLIGKGISSDNISPMNLVYIRKVGYETRNIDDFFKSLECNENRELSIKEILKDDPESINKLLKKILKKILEN